MMIKRLLMSAVLGLGLFSHVSADAQTYPNQPIRLIITNPAGGLPDTVARIFGRRMEEKLGQPVVIENRAGANGSIAVQAMLNSPANGYAFVVTDGAIYTVNPILYPDNPYQQKDLKPISILATAPMFLALHPKVPANNLEEFLAYVRANPGKLNYGSAGVGSMHHLSAVALGQGLKLDMTHVPFKGTGEAVPALLGGHIDALFSAYPALSGAAEAKQVKLIAANSGARSGFAPQLPSLAERIPGYDYAPRQGLYGRADTPPNVIKVRNDVLAEIAKEPDTAKKLEVIGVEAVGSDAATHQKALDAESAKMRELLRVTGLIK
jgi:tripartite-type tricarboxylate transporter receptor subunit TctC